MDTRRHFLIRLSGGALGATLIPNLSCPADIPAAPSQADDRVLKVALLGLGGYAERVAEAMKSSTRAKLTGLISGTPEKLKTWAAKYHVPAKNCYNYSNYDAIKDNPEIDAVYVITPNALHKEGVLRVAKAGKHAISEKPMSVNAKEGQEMVDGCKAAGVKLLVGYRMHFEPHTLEIVRMRKAGELGRITFFNGLSGFVIGDPTQWRLNKSLSGGGSLMDIGIYALNASRYFTGEEPVWVTAEETKTDPVKFKEGVDETIQFQLGFPSGAVASCLSTYNADGLDRFFVTGSKGWAELYPASGYGPIAGNTNKGPINKPVTIHQAVQMDEFSDIIFRGKVPEVPVDGEEAVRDLKIMDAIYAACSGGKKIML